MKALVSFIIVLALALVAYAGASAGLETIFGVIIPYAALFLFLVGFLRRLLKWANVPVPFRIPTTCGQQKTLPWIKNNELENPSGTLGVLGRMALEVFLFRSLFRNLKTEKGDGASVAYGSDKWLWLAGIAFHYSFLVVVIRHLRLFAEPVPPVVHMIEAVDGFFQIGAPRLLMTGVILLAAVTYLFIRRVTIPQVKYISLPADYFPLFLIGGIAFTGILMRYFSKVDIISTKTFLISLVQLSPQVPDGKVGAIFFVHLFLVSTLFAYFPFSKLVHLGGVFLSPTRNLANNSRMKRHINPWNYPVKVHTYEEYEDDFRDKMKGVGLPVEKE